MNKIIPPFWDVVPTFFLLPLRGVGLATLLLFSAIVTILPSTLTYLAIFFATIKYAMEILQNTAKGKLEAPSLSIKMLNEHYKLPFKQLILFMLPSFVLSKFGDISPVVNIVFILFCSIVLPASVMTLAYTRHLRAAINPFELIGLITRLGWSYVILYVFLFLLSGAAPTAHYFFIENIGPSVFFTILFQIYFFWVMYAMMGYVLYQFHEVIGYELPHERTNRVNKINHKVAPLLIIEDAIEKEDYSTAQSDLKYLITRNPNDLALRRKFHKLVKISGNSTALITQGAEMIGRLLEVKKNVEAANVYLDCIQASPIFKPIEESDYFPLAHELKMMRQFKKAVALCKDFHISYPNSSTIPPLYLLNAEILIEDLSDYDNAKPILSYLKTYYIGHDIEDKVDRYNHFLSKV